jgi:hypothetical protein
LKNPGNLFEREDGMDTVMWLIVGSIFLAGILAGFVITAVTTRVKATGYLHVITDNPEDGPYLFLELTSGLDHLAKKDCVVLKVKYPQK